jgi:hypothetical protein
VVIEKYKMENIIRRAIEGGYKKIKNPFEVSGQYSDWVKFHNGSLMVQNKIYEYLFDPLFWQSLSKACGWGAKHRFSYKHDMQIYGQEEIEIALRFHEINLTESFDKAVEYLISLINEE